MIAPLPGRRVFLGVSIEVLSTTLVSIPSGHERQHPTVRCRLSQKILGSSLSFFPDSDSFNS